MVEAWQAAPAQQEMKTKGKEWALPSIPPIFRPDGVNWEKWEADAKPPDKYDPPQFATGYLPKSSCTCWNWWQQRSRVWCCCACCVYKCCVKNVEYLPFEQPDEWMVKMLSTGVSPKCPKRLQGIFWLQDNIAAHEHLVTFHDADWATERLGLKDISYNWTRGPTAFGAFLACFVQSKGYKMRLEVSPNEKWLSFCGSGEPQWMYMPSPGEQYTTPDGKTIVPDPEELMRVSFKDSSDYTSEVTYQYRVRKIAYLSEDGTLVKTSAYNDLLEAATMPLEPSPCCFGQYWCVSDEQRAYKNMPQLPSQTVVKYAPPPPGAAVASGPKPECIGGQ